jgi:cytoplasmic iron level regulating protein YaaA (DUF328/UPF0246 family)
VSSRTDREPLLLLPPSEGKAPSGGRGSWDPGSGRFGTLAVRRLEVAEALSAAGGGDERLLGVRGDLLLLARSANIEILRAPTLPAWRRYTGVVWDHLDPATIDPATRRRIVVVSGLLGLVRADDPVPYYRLKMSANLPPVGKLSTWWRDDLSTTLARAARRSLIVDLLPQEHRAALDATGIDGVRVDLVDPSGAPGGHFAKAAKGRLARSILTDGLESLDDWTHERFVVRTAPLG